MLAWRSLTAKDQLVYVSSYSLFSRRVHAVYKYSVAVTQRNHSEGLEQEEFITASLFESLSTSKVKCLRDKHSDALLGVRPKMNLVDGLVDQSKKSEA